MNDLHTWLSQQHHGLRTFRTFQQKLDDVSRGDPEQRALCRLLDAVVSSYIDTFDEEPLPVAVADLHCHGHGALPGAWCTTWRRQAHDPGIDTSA